MCSRIIFLFPFVFFLTFISCEKEYDINSPETSQPGQLQKDPLINEVWEDEDKGWRAEVRGRRSEDGGRMETKERKKESKEHCGCSFLF